MQEAFAPPSRGAGSRRYAPMVTASFQKGSALAFATRSGRVNWNQGRARTPAFDVELLLALPLLLTLQALAADCTCKTGATLHFTFVYSCFPLFWPWLSPPLPG